jgi:hypothetical protein
MTTIQPLRIFRRDPLYVEPPSLEIEQRKLQ